MEDIEITVRRDVTVKVDVGIVIDTINSLPMVARWNYIAQLLRDVDADELSLTPERYEIVKKYLMNKLSLFEKQEKTNELAPESSKK